MDASEIYWLPFKAVYQQLQAANRSTLSGLGGQLNLNFQWLLDGLNKFERPNDKSLAALNAGKSLKASTWGTKRGIAVDKHLISATVELSELLDLDQLQCHLLLKRWLKDNDIIILPPLAATAAADATAAAPLALPAPGGAASSTSTAAAAAPGQAVLSADMVQGVADYYAQERIYLSKCQQFIIMTAMQVTTDPSRTCRDILKRLLDAGWESKTFVCLAALLSDKQQSEAASNAAASQAAGGLNHLVKPSDFEQRLHLHNLHERCELLCLLTQLYCGPDPSCSPHSHAMQLMTQQHEEQQDLVSEQEAHDSAAAVAEIAGLSWPECSEERLLKLLQLLGEAVFLQGTLNGSTTSAPRAATAASRSAYSQAATMQQLAEALASSLILAVLNPSQLLEKIAESAGMAAAGGSLPRSTTQFRQWRSIEAALMQWRLVPGCVLPMLAVFAYNQLLASYRGAADSISPSIQTNALQAGGFAAIAAPLALEELAPNSLAGALHRGLLLQSMSLMASAFDLSPLLLPGPLLQQLIAVVVDAVKGCPHLTQQVWDEANITYKPIRYLLDETCSLFPAFPGPFLQLATGLAQGQESAAACYGYICNKPCLAVEYQAETSGVILQGAEAVLDVDMPWAKAPEVEGSIVPQGSRGRLMQLPEFAKPPATSEGGAPPPASFLVAWEVDAEQGTGPVLLLARAAHCLQQLHVAAAGRQAVAATEYWQDLRLILQLVAALLKADSLLAKPLMSVTIVYNSNQQMDWLDVLVAALNVLPALAAAAGGSTASAPVTPASSAQQASTSFCHEMLSALADCLLAAAAVASCQPGRVMGALGSCQLFAGVGSAAEPLGLVALEDLSSWAQHQQEEGGVAMAENTSNLTNLQALQESFEVPHSRYPLTRAVLQLVQTLLNQHCTWGLVPSLVHHTLNRVLGAMPWMPFSSTSDRWSLAAAALGVVRSAILSGAVATAGAAGPKAAGPPGGLMVTTLAARVINHLATAGHGYLSSVLPPPSDDLQGMAEQQAGSSQLLAAGTQLAEQLLLLVSVIQPAVAHLSPEIPLQQYWGTTPAGGGLSPAAVIGSYATYPYATHLSLLALEALVGFAILQTAPAAGSLGTPIPSAGGPPVPSGVLRGPAGVGPVTGPIQQGLNPAQPYLRGVHVATAAGMGVGGRGGAGGWWRPSGLFACLFAALPGLRPALLRPFELSFAQAYPEWALRSMALLEAGVRYHPEVLDALCFPSSLTLPVDDPGTGPTAAAAAAAAAPEGPAAKAAKTGTDKANNKPHSALDGLYQLLKQAPELLQSQPKLLAAGMRLLSTLWESQGSAHLAVELLRSQPGFWSAIKACCPAPGLLPSVAAGADPSDAEAAAWKLQIHTCALHILLLELLSVQVASDSSSTAPSSSSSSSHEVLLASFGPLEVSKLLVSASDLGVQHVLLDQLVRMLQVTYLQLGASSVVGAWGPASLNIDSLTVATQFRREVQPLLDAAAAGEYSLEDLRVACDLLADPDNAEEALAAAAARHRHTGEEDEIMEGGVDEAGNLLSVGGDGQRGRILVDALTARPFGELLLSFSAVTPNSWAAGETEYGRHFLFDSSRLCQLLGPFNLEGSEGAIALAITLDDVSAAAAVAHARLALLQAATSLFASLSRNAGARQQLMSADVCRSLLTGSIQGVKKAMSESTHLSSSPAARLLSLSWGLPFLGHASSTALLLAARSLLLSVRFWKVSSSSATDSTAAGAKTQNTGRTVLMARDLNDQDLGFAGPGGFKQQQQQGLTPGGAADDGEVLSAAACCAQLLGQWLRGQGGESLAAAAAAATPTAAETDVEIIGCLSTSLLLLLQALPGQWARAAAAAASGRVKDAASPSSSKFSPGAGRGSAAVSDNVSNNLTPAELLELETALLDLLPALYRACAIAVEQQQKQQQQQQQQQGADAAQHQSYAPAMLQLLIEILQHQLQPSLWVTAVSQNLALAPLLAAAAARAGSGTNPAAADGTAAAAAAVTDISLLELTLAVAQVPEGALQLWQQGYLDVLVEFCRQLLHTGQNTGLLDASSLGLVGPSAAAAAAAATAVGFSKVELPAHWGVSLATLGAYTSASSSSSSSSHLQTGAGLQIAAAAAAAGGCIWSPRHQQWCLLLGLLNTSLQQLSKSADVEGLAMQILITTEPRLMLALQMLSGAAGQQQQQQQHTSPAAAAAGMAGSHAHGVLSLAWGPTIDPEGLLLDGSSGLGSREQSAPVLLTLGGLLEAERVLFLLGFMVPHIGVWQLQRPGSLAAFRTAAARLVEFVAAPSLDRSLRASCSPLSPFERRLSKLPSGLEASDGWFKVCSAGGANLNLAATSSSAAAAAGDAAAAAAGGGSTALVIATGPTSPRVESSPRAASGSGSGFKGSGGAAAGLSPGGFSSSGSLVGPSGVGGCCSEYCARLCEAVYTACEHSLQFLLATAPVVEPAEVAAAAAAAGGGGGLGPMWPSAKALSALQDQVLAVGTSMVQYPQSISPRRRRIAAACVRIAVAAGRLLEAVAPVRWTGSRGRTGVDAAADFARRQEKILQIQRGIGQS